MRVPHVVIARVVRRRRAIVAVVVERSALVRCFQAVRTRARQNKAKNAKQANAKRASHARHDAPTTQRARAGDCGEDGVAVGARERDVVAAESSRRTNAM
jgi:hypothetical protein